MMQILQHPQILWLLRIGWVNQAQIEKAFEGQGSISNPLSKLAELGLLSADQVQQVPTVSTLGLQAPSSRPNQQYNLKHHHESGSGSGSGRLRPSNQQLQATPPNPADTRAGSQRFNSARLQRSLEQTHLTQPEPETPLYDSTKTTITRPPSRQFNAQELERRLSQSSASFQAAPPANRPGSQAYDRAQLEQRLSQSSAYYQAVPPQPQGAAVHQGPKTGSFQAVQGGHDTVVGPEPRKGPRTGRFATPETAFQVGPSFRDYRILNELNKGSFGTIYRAQNPQGRMVALKFLVGVESTSLERSRFRREARVLKQLEHPNIVRCLDYGEEGDQAFVAMEYIEGQDLHNVITEGFHGSRSMPELPWILSIFTDLANALAYCHAKNIIHRDIKPANILIEHETQQAVLIDFGLVKRTNVGASAVTSSSSRQLLHDSSQGKKLTDNTPDISYTPNSSSQGIHGTPYFMSPEQTVPNNSFGSVGTSADVWAFGATLYFALTGQPPFPGTSLIEIFTNIGHSDAKRPSSLNPEVEPWLDELILSCLKKTGADRPSMLGVLRGLRENTRIDRRISKLSTPLMALFIAIGLALGLGLGFSATNLNQPEAPTVARLDYPAYATTDKVTITGLVRPSNAYVSISGEDIVTQPTGQFETTLPLKPGLNQFVLSVQRPHEICVTQPLTIFRETQVPKIVWCTRKSKTYHTLASSQLEGQLKSASPCQLTILGKTFDLSPEQSFSVDLPLRNELQFIKYDLLDAAQRYHSGTLKILSPEAIQNRRQLMQRGLKGLKNWQSCTEKIQDIILTEVERHLHPDFELAATETFSTAETMFRCGVFRHRRTGLLLNLIPGDSFTMGTDNIELEEKYFEQYGPKNTSASMPFGRGPSVQHEGPAHKVTLQPFLIGQTEVHQAAWDRFAGVDSRERKGENQPIHNVSHEAVKDWLLRAGSLRLPTEAEWEYACRAPILVQHSARRFYWGQKMNPEHCWYVENSQGRFHSVDAHQKMTNAFGLSDMLGNLSEWCEDTYSRNYQGASETGEAARSAMRRFAFLRVIRGGDWNSPRAMCRSASRAKALMNTQSTAIGFRVVSDLSRLQLFKDKDE